MTFITAAEATALWRQIKERRLGEDSPEYQEFISRIRERDDYLYETYGKRYYDSHYGKWIAVSVNGEVIIDDTSGQVIWAASEKFGNGNFCMRKLAEFPGHRLLTPGVIRKIEEDENSNGSGSQVARNSENE